MLARCLKSVYEQQVEAECQLVMAQSITDGLNGIHHCSVMQSWVLPAVRSEFVMRLADDDALLPNHIETLLPYLGDADVVYSYDASGNRPREDCSMWPQSHLIAELGYRNWIDGSAVAIRTSSLRAVGGWPTEWDYQAGKDVWHGGHFKGMRQDCDDHAVWYLLAQAGARFKCVPEATWVYDGAQGHNRLSEGNYA